MGSRQSPAFEAINQQYDERDPPPPYHVAVGETGLSSQQGNSDWTTSRLRPSRLETENVAATTSSPTTASPQNQALDEIDYFRLGLQQSRANWDRIEASVLIIHDEMVSATSQLARSRRQRQADARLCRSLEQELRCVHTRWLDAERRAAEAEARVRELERHREHVWGELDSGLKQLRKAIASKKSPSPNNGDYGLMNSFDSLQNR